MESEIPLESFGASLIQQGAEARIYDMMFLQKRTVVKERFSKQYRHPTLDQKLSVSRLKQEARCIARCSKAGIDTPTVYFLDLHAKRLYLEYIEGRTVKAAVHAGALSQPEFAASLSSRIGSTLATMHDENIVHGDLTTSNMMLRAAPADSLALIDFGLAYTSTLLEDKAVDLYVLERAFLSTHPNTETFFEQILAAYAKKSKKAAAVLSKLGEVRLRGRKKLAFG
eukprot:TRINITY_DN6613_c0_g1_i1.p1 TRINITY_DN6613_c0_g1~~TRINITY_DN6613_c0_g1_i1.p1  ORF type:complete len:226 (+),score=59.67 TRINITY_DN6613_c0_g1_i1:80-757(+)